MQNLILNRVDLQFSEGLLPPIVFSASESKEHFFKANCKSVQKALKLTDSDELVSWMNSNAIDDSVWFGFKETSDLNVFEFKDVTTDNKFFLVKYIRFVLIEHFRSLDFFVEPAQIGCDLSIYEKTDDFNEQWSIYRRIDMTIRLRRKELTFNIGSEATLISKEDCSTVNLAKKYVDTSSKFIERIKDSTVPNGAQIIATNEIKVEIGYPFKPRFPNYKETYLKLNEFYRKHLLQVEDELFRLNVTGLKNVEPFDISTVNFNQNKMMFGNNKTDINAFSGMRDFGPYRKSPKSSDIKFIFIYENRDDANKLYQYLKNGLKHFPGLLSYVGIAPTLDLDKSLKYSNENSLKTEFDQFLQDSLQESTYENHFAIVISHLNKSESDDEQSELYFHLKESLLSKGISSQFIYYKRIREGSFHYHLPNIAIAILAKLGGIPWRLESKKQTELIIGFNQIRLGEGRFIGSSVFFDNEGRIGKIAGFPEFATEAALISSLREAIESYINEIGDKPERLVIHYFKPNSKTEKQRIEDLIQKELKLSLPFAIIEINDGKSQDNICFDSDYNHGMPISGTYVKTGYNEYLLFNNTRYEKNPTRRVSEELPIKVKIHFADTGGFSHRDLVSQVYEFSRLYWKGLKQRSQPVTTLYSKLIADFAAHFDGKLPENKLVNTTPWFL